MKIRPASRNDLPALERLLRESFAASYALFMPGPYVQQWRLGDEPARTLNRHLGNIAVAVVNDSLAGFVAVSAGSVAELWVRPSMKRRGVGTALLHWAEEKLREEGQDRATLTCYERNTEGLAFYRSQGYDITSRHPSRRVAGGPVTVCTLAKPLDGSGGRRRA
jgi:ribosomal protein S18 acetylase RimI-like enzyme